MAADATKRAIINADDFGFSAGVTEGILQAHLRGVVTSTTVAANMPAAEAALKRLADVPNLGVGVHLNISQGPPLSDQGRRLAGDDGLMNRSAAGVIKACILRPGLLDAAAAEMDAQIRFVLDRGICPTHLDSHRHSHAFGPIFRRVAALARRYNIPFIRWHGERLPGPAWPACPSGQRRIARVLNAMTALRGGAGAGLRGTLGTWGVAHTGCIDSAWLALAASRLPAGVVEIMTHPGAGDDLDPAATRLLESRRRELAALCDPAVRRAFAANGIELIHYGHLRSRG
jgi:predicted glycoside hydrolase/deacetylase ChbG (UPF0249 family)